MFKIKTKFYLIIKIIIIVSDFNLFLIPINCKLSPSSTLDNSILNKIKFTTINDWFQQWNEQLLLINQYSADISWELTTNNFITNNLIDNGIKLGTIKSKWRNIRCDESKKIQFKNKLNENEKRMLYLLCRGPKFTDYQTNELGKILNKMENIYTMTEICIPKHFDVCRNIDKIWDYTFVRDFNDDLYFLNLSSVQPKNRKNISTKLYFYDGKTSDNDDYGNDYILHRKIYDPLQNTENLKNIPLMCFNGEPELETLMTGDFSILKRDDCMLDINEIFRWTWESWRMAVGPEIGQIYPNAIQLMNIGANNNGYHDIGEVWKEELEMPNIRTKITKLLDDIKPLYTLLHGVLRNLLRKKFKSTEKFNHDDLIPAHILGNMWSQNWENYLELILPFPEMNLDVNLKKTNWTTIDMVKRAEDFYTSLSLNSMTKSFWKNSYFEKSENLTNCHGTAANMFQQNDFRMIVCAKKTLNDFYVIHHELGHIQYYMSYDQQPTIFQDGNSMLQETIGDVIFMGACVPQHLNRLQLIPDQFLYPDKNFLYNTGGYMDLIHSNDEHDDEKNDADDDSVEDQLNQLNNMLVDEDTVEYLKNIKIKYKKSKSKSSHKRKEKISKNHNEFPMNTFDLSLLLKMALTKIPQIPFEYILDIFRWDLFSSKIKMSDANEYFWELVKNEQGVRPPEHNKRTNLFDAGAKFHVPDNTPYVRYFLASFLQAQIFRGLCEITVFGTVGQHKKLPMPLHRCDIYGSKRAGKLLKKAMKLGTSVHWTEILYILTGKREITADALLEYYQPLINWLEKLVIKYNITLGW